MIIYTFIYKLFKFTLLTFTREGKGLAAIHNLPEKKFSYIFKTDNFLENNFWTIPPPAPLLILYMDLISIKLILLVM